MADLTPDYNRRDCTLPWGCVDLLDLLNLEVTLVEEKNAPTELEVELGKHLSKPIGVVEFGPFITVDDLTEKLSRRPHEVIELLIKADIFIDDTTYILTFDEAAAVARAFGLEARLVVN